MDLSVCIVNWNTKDMTAECLRSLEAALPRVNFEVVLVDNGSTDGSVEMIRNDFPWVSLIANGHNAGFAGANNRAIATTIGRYVLLLNSDTIVLDGALDRMVATLDRDRQLGVVGACLLNPDRSPQHCCGSFPTLWTEMAAAFSLDRRWPLRWLLRPALPVTGELIDVDWVLGASLMVRREALAAVGPLDERFFMFSEEIDLCRRIKQAGWRIAAVSKAKIVHLGGGTSRRTPLRSTADLYCSKVKYFRKHHGALQADIYRVAVLASAVIRLAVLPLWPGKQTRSNERQAWVEAIKVLWRAALVANG